MINSWLIERYRQFKEQAYKQLSRFHHIENLEGPNVLVLSPHPDDDIFGCAGTMARHIEQGHRVRVVYLCSGDKGGKTGDRKKLTDIRRDEAIRATENLGIDKSFLTFLNCPDEQLKPTRQRIEQLKSLLLDFSPDIVYLPSFLDNHPDHLNTNYLLKAAAVKKFKIAAYEIWTPIIPNRLVDISKYIELKSAAISAHKSQLEQMDYRQAILGLNQYRAKMYSKKQMDYAEAFLFMSSKTYFDFLDKL